MGRGFKASYKLIVLSFILKSQILFIIKIKKSTDIIITKTNK